MTASSSARFRPARSAAETAEGEVRSRPALRVDGDCAAALDVSHHGMPLGADDSRAEKPLVEGGAPIGVGALDGDVIEPWHARRR